MDVKFLPPKQTLSSDSLLNASTAATENALLIALLCYFVVACGFAYCFVFFFLEERQCIYLNNLNSEFLKKCSAIAAVILHEECTISGIIIIAPAAS